MVIGGIAIALISFGIATDVALWLSLALLVLILLVSYLVYQQHRRITSQPKKYSYFRVRGEVKLADWIARIVSTKAPREWTEYQDWLHDLLLNRRQLLEKGESRLRVTALTYWRLMGFCITVSAIKLKRLAVSHRRRL
ncbi:MAG: hypothetical protein F6K45_25845 [Kamptonema sp. SIO1D9]|nr:hypothetical protein [Kamptonema sp. SIO1D9]